MHRPALPALPALRRAWLAGSLDAADRAALADDDRAGARALHAQIARSEAAAAAEAKRLRGMLRYERRLWATGAQFVAGVDEVGVGPLAGPVVAAID